MYQFTLETIFPANLLTGANHAVFVFSTNYSADIDKTQHSFNHNGFIMDCCCEHLVAH